jgi:hypothetical protein
MSAERASQQVAFAAQEVLCRHGSATFSLHPEHRQQSFARLHRETGLFHWCFDGGGESDDDAGRLPISSVAMPRESAALSYRGE